MRVAHDSVTLFFSSHSSAAHDMSSRARVLADCSRLPVNGQCCDRRSLRRSRQLARNAEPGRCGWVERSIGYIAATKAEPRRRCQRAVPYGRPHRSEHGRNPVLRKCRTVPLNGVIATAHIMLVDRLDPVDARLEFTYALSLKGRAVRPGAISSRFWRANHREQRRKM